MKERTTHEEANKLLEQGFEYLVTHGIENASLRSIASGIGCSPSNLYNYFEDKDDCIIEITRYGFSKVAGAILDYAVDNISDLKFFFDTFLDKLENHINELRAVYQVATSPFYGDRMREAAENLQPVYNKYIKKLSEITCCREDLLYPTVFNFISVILDYAVWHDRPVTEIQLRDLYETIVQRIKISMSESQED